MYPKTLFKPKFQFFDENFNFLTKILIFDENFNFWPKFWFLTNISIFDQNFDFWPKFQFLTNILIFEENFNFWPKFQFWPKLQFLTKTFDFSPKFWRCFFTSLVQSNCSCCGKTASIWDDVDRNVFWIYSKIDRSRTSDRRIWPVDQLYGSGQSSKLDTVSRIWKNR